jgi:SAM-dependent methyltransferase
VTLQPQLIQTQYDEVIAAHYDDDPHAILGDSLGRALAQVAALPLAGPAAPPLRVLDIGMGTGRFLGMLAERLPRPVRPYGLDLSPRMLAVARSRLAGLEAACGDAADLDAHFPGTSFDLIATHFITGFVPARVLAPQVRRRLAPGGYWSLVGGTKAGFPELQKRANAKSLRWLFRGQRLAVDELVHNPADRAEVVRTLEENGFAARAAETFTPEFRLANFQQFLAFGYYGGWLTPFIEALALHRAPPLLRVLLNAFVFPVTDHHCIEIVLAQKVG